MDIFARSEVNINAPFGGAGFIQINVYENIVSNGEELYSSLVDAVPGLNSSIKDEDKADKFVKAYKTFEDAVKKEFSNNTPAFDKKSTPLDSFYMPIPNSIDEVYSQSFEPSSFNIDNVLMQAGLTKASNTADKANGTLGNMVGDVIETVKHLGSRGNATIDPNLINVYVGSTPRSFTYNIDFMPQNKEEVINVLNILTRLYKKSLGIKSKIKVGKLDLGIIKSAHVFTIEYFVFDENGDFVVNKYLSSLLNTNINSSGFFLSDISYDIGQTSNIQLFDVKGEIQYDEANDFYTLNTSESSFKVPKVINIVLTFVEYRPLYANDWKTIIDNAKGATS